MRGRWSKVKWASSKGKTSEADISAVTFLKGSIFVTQGCGGPQLEAKGLDTHKGAKASRARDSSGAQVRGREGRQRP